MIPTEKTKVSLELGNYHWLIYGQPKIGKSTFVSQFPKVLFIPTEPGLGSLSIYKATDKDHIGSWPEFVDICKEISASIKEGTFKFDTIAIDTVDNLYDMCLEYVCKREGIKHPSEGSFGAGWAKVTSEFKKTMLRMSGITKIIFISHDKEVETEVQKMKIQRTTPTIAGGEKGRFVLGLVDFIVYISNDPNDRTERVAYFRGHDGLVAGDRTGKMEPMMDFDYKTIKEHFNKKG